MNRQILDEASEWFVDFRVGDVDAEARARFDEWLRRSPEHIRAYMEIARTYVELPPVDSSKLDVAALIAYAHSDSNVLPLNPGGRAEPKIERTPYPRRFSLAAACIAFVLVVAATLYGQINRYPLYTTDIGERRSITLADGSTVDLNARSQLRVEFSKTERRVVLLNGQALFQVAKDTHRAFIVHSGAATVRAVGTQFDVYRKDSGTTVTVLEGRVAVYATARSAGTAEPPSDFPQDAPLPPATTHTASSPHAPGTGAAMPTPPPGLTDPSGAAAVLLSAGEQVTVTPDAIVPSQHADLAAATAWTQRKLIFDGSKLSDVASEFNRYNRQQIVIEGARLSDFHVSGVYSSTDPTSLIRFLRDQGVKITESDSEIRIEPQ